MIRWQQHLHAVDVSAVGHQLLPIPPVELDRAASLWAGAEDLLDQAWPLLGQPPQLKYHCQNHIPRLTELCKTQVLRLSHAESFDKVWVLYPKIKFNSTFYYNKSVANDWYWADKYMIRHVLLSEVSPVGSGLLQRISMNWSSCWLFSLSSTSLAPEQSRHWSFPTQWVGYREHMLTVSLGVRRKQWTLAVDPLLHLEVGTRGGGGNRFTFDSVF